MTQLTISIDRVVLDGFEPAHRRRFQEAFHATLAEKAKDRAAELQLASSGRALNLSLQPCETPEQLGVALAEGLVKGLLDGGAR